MYVINLVRVLWKGFKQLHSPLILKVEVIRSKEETLFHSRTVQLMNFLPVYNSVKKGKAVPLQAWSCPEGSRKLRFSDFITTVQDGGKIVSLTHRPTLLPGNTPDTYFC